MKPDPEQQPEARDPHAPSSLDEHLRREEPPIADDDTSPSRRVTPSERIAADEPPVQEGDTQPRTAAPLQPGVAIPEPPITLEDTNPSHPVRPAAPPLSGGPGRLAWIAVVLVFVLAIAAGATVILLREGDDEPAAEPGDSAALDVTATASLGASTALPGTPTAQAIAEAAEDGETADAETDAETNAEPNADTPIIRPTAAADEIAAALLTPVPDAPQSREIQRDAEPFTIRPVNARADVTIYTVRDGDTLETIANNFGLDDYYSLIWSNRSSKLSELAPGTQITIPPEDGVYHEVTEDQTIREIAEQYGVDPYAIIDTEYNDELLGSVPETVLPAGLWIFVPGGEGERFNDRITGSGSLSGGGAAGGLLSSGTYSLWGCTTELQGGTEPYGRPLTGYTWMRGFIPDYHDGVDLAGREEQPVLAAGAGTVVYAGWNSNGYGRVVVVAHSASFSLYGHLNSIDVSCGQYVGAGQKVGGMGNTGNTSGTHLHFEVRNVDFAAVNPQNYVGF